MKTKIIFLNKKTEEIEKNLHELEKSLSKLKWYYDYDDIEYKGIRNVKNVFNLSLDKYYYKPIRTKCALNGYIEYESQGDKDIIFIWSDHI